MNPKGYMNMTSAMWAENRLLKFVVVVIGVMSLWNTIQIQRSFDSQKTILIPPVMPTPLEISGSHASESTLDAYGRYVVSLMGTFTPSTARSQFDALLTFYAPESFEEAKIQLYDLADRIEVSLVSNTFFVQKVISTPRELKVYGLNKQFSEATTLGDEKRVYLIKYKIMNGRFFLTQVRQELAEDGGRS